MGSSKRIILRKNEFYKVYKVKSIISTKKEFSYVGTFKYLSMDKRNILMKHPAGYKESFPNDLNLIRFKPVQRKRA